MRKRKSLIRENLAETRRENKRQEKVRVSKYSDPTRKGIFIKTTFERDELVSQHVGRTYKHKQDLINDGTDLLLDLLAVDLTAERVREAFGIPSKEFRNGNYKEL